MDYGTEIVCECCAEYDGFCIVCESDSFILCLIKLLEHSDESVANNRIGFGLQIERL